MLSKFCILKIDGERAHGQLISNVRDEYIQISLSRFGNIKPRVGDVFEIDYAMRAIAILGLSDEKFFNIEADVVRTTKIRHPVVAKTEEEAKEILRERILRDPARYTLETSSEILDESAEVSYP